MIAKKIKKHLSISRTRLNQKDEFKKIYQCQNDTLQKVAAALIKVIQGDFIAEDLQAFQDCEAYRTRLLQDETLISYEIFGSENTAKVKDICKNAASGTKWCEFLYFLSKETQATTILEIGTNLGISGCYILKSIQNNPKAKLITMEGLPQLCEISARQFATVTDSSQFDIRRGLFDTTFPQLVKEDIQFDLLFIDGNHQKEPTIAYFNALKDNINSPSIFVFDDINWSDEMQEAWSIIKNDNRINFSIDLYKQGIVIIDSEESAKSAHFRFHLAY